MSHESELYVIFPHILFKSPLKFMSDVIIMDIMCD